MDKLFERLKMQKKLEVHEGHTLFRLLLKMRSSYVIYFANYFELNSELNIYKNAGSLRYDNAYRWRRQSAITRGIHNLIFSAQSYFEHIDKNNYEDISPDFQKLKIKEICKLRKNSLFHFIRSLRNFITHHQTYPLLSRGDGITGNDGQKSFLIYQSLKTEKFETYLNEMIAKNPKHHHDKMALSYLNESSEKINFDKVLLEYHSMVLNFHSLIILSFIKENLEVFKKFVKSLLEMHEEFTPDRPIDPLQLRYLRYLIMKAEQL